MAATGNDIPIAEISGHHSQIAVWRVTATGVSSFTIQTGFANRTVIVTVTSEGTALTAQPAIALSTGIITVAGVAAGDIVNVKAEAFN